MLLYKPFYDPVFAQIFFIHIWQPHVGFQLILPATHVNDQALHVLLNNRAYQLFSKLRGNWSDAATGHVHNQPHMFEPDLEESDTEEQLGAHKLTFYQKPHQTAALQLCAFLGYLDGGQFIQIALGRGRVVQCVLCQSHILHHILTLFSF